MYGSITHTELASTNPQATKDWCSTVFDWDFTAELPTPTGGYRLFTYSKQGGGGIRPTSEGEMPTSIPFVHVKNTDEAFVKALEAGAEKIYVPDTKMPGVRVALVKAPGGVLIGFSGPSEPVE